MERTSVLIFLLKLLTVITHSEAGIPINLRCCSRPTFPTFSRSRAPPYLSAEHHLTCRPGIIVTSSPDHETEDKSVSPEPTSQAVVILHKLPNNDDKHVKIVITTERKDDKLIIDKNNNDDSITKDKIKEENMTNDKVIHIHNNNNIHFGLGMVKECKETQDEGTTNNYENDNSAYKINDENDNDNPAHITLEKDVSLGSINNVDVGTIKETVANNNKFISLNNDDSLNLKDKIDVPTEVSNKDGKEKEISLLPTTDETKQEISKEIKVIADAKLATDKKEEGTDDSLNNIDATKIEITKEIDGKVATYKNNENVEDSINNIDESVNKTPTEIEKPTTTGDNNEEENKEIDENSIKDNSITEEKKDDNGGNNNAAIDNGQHSK